MPLIPIGTSSNYPNLKLNSEIIQNIQEQMRMGRFRYPNLKITSGIDEYLAVNLLLLLDVELVLPT